MKVKQYETYFREKFDKERFYAGHATNYGPINKPENAIWQIS